MNEALRPRTLVEGLKFPESLVWHDGALWCVDLHTHAVLAVTPAGSATTITRIDASPSAVGFLPDGRLLVGERWRCRLLAGEGATLSPFADLSALGGASIGNFCSRGDGTLFVSLRAERGYDPAELTLRDGEQGKGDWLVRIDPAGRASLVADGLIGPYNCALLDGERTLVVDEARGQRLTAFDVAPDGSLSARRTFLALDGRPIGGASIDSEGGVWVGAPMDHEFLRIVPGGEVTDVLRVGDARWAVGCELGGDDGLTLFLAVVDTTLENQALLANTKDDTLSTAKGRIDVVRVAVPGLDRPEDRR